MPFSKKFKYNGSNHSTKNFVIKMPTYSVFKPGDEKDLHIIIREEKEALEEELEILGYEVNIGGKKPDFLCKDSESALTVVEIKLEEDENIIWQGLKYYNEVEKNKYFIVNMYKNKIDPEKKTRIILIAKRFSDDQRRICNYIKPKIELYEYITIKDENNKKGIVFQQREIPLISTLDSPAKISDRRAYLKIEDLKKEFDKITNQIKSMSNEGLEEYPTNSYVAYSYRNKIIAAIITKRNSFEIIVNHWDESKQNIVNQDKKIIEKAEEEYAEIIKKIKLSLSKMKEN